MRHPFLPKIANMFHDGGAREIFNVHHMKWYVFDNKVILTG
jgi:phosphatidylserine/phosphatidylglycerophosphate/cardiolipin synthase-like enzyme